MNIHKLLFLMCMTPVLSAMETKSVEHYQSVGYLRQPAEQRVPSLKFLAAQQLYRSKILERVDASSQAITQDLLENNVLHMRKDIAQTYTNQQSAAICTENKYKGVRDKIRVFNLIATVNS